MISKASTAISATSPATATAADRGHLPKPAVRQRQQHDPRLSGSAARQVERHLSRHIRHVLARLRRAPRVLPQSRSG